VHTLYISTIQVPLLEQHYPGPTSQRKRHFLILSSDLISGQPLDNGYSYCYYISYIYDIRMNK
jgi:hypothetical protein